MQRPRQRPWRHLLQPFLSTVKFVGFKKTKSVASVAVFAYAGDVQMGRHAPREFAVILVTIAGVALGSEIMTKLGWPMAQYLILVESGEAHFQFDHQRHPPARSQRP